MNFLLVAIGGAAGSVARYALGLICTRANPNYPFGILGANISGCFAMGIVTAVLLNAGGREEYRLLLAVGFLGGYTTFSSYGLDAIVMLTEQKIAQAMIYILATNVLGIFAVYAGMKLGGWK